MDKTKQRPTIDDIIEKCGEIHYLFHELEKKYHDGYGFIYSWNNYVCSFSTFLNQIEYLFKNSPYEVEIYSNYKEVREKYFLYLKEVEDIRNEITHCKNQKIKSTSSLCLLNTSTRDNKSHRIKFFTPISSDNSKSSDIIVKDFFQNQKKHPFYKTFANNEDYYLSLYRDLFLIDSNGQQKNVLHIFQQALLKLGNFMYEILIMVEIECICENRNAGDNKSIFSLHECSLPLDKIKYKIYEMEQLITS